MLTNTYLPILILIYVKEGVFRFQELLKCTVDLADLIGLSLVMARIAGKGNTKVLIAGLGWAGAELILSRLLVLWVGARGTEFDWKYIQKSFDANISMVNYNLYFQFFYLLKLFN